MSFYCDFAVREDVFSGQFQQPTDGGFTQAHDFHSRPISKIKNNFYSLESVKH